jgi:hypothetical protein
LRTAPDLEEVEVDIELFDDLSKSKFPDEALHKRCHITGNWGVAKTVGHVLRHGLLGDISGHV